MLRMTYWISGYCIRICYNSWGLLYVHLRNNISSVHYQALLCWSNTFITNRKRTWTTRIHNIVWVVFCHDFWMTGLSYVDCVILRPILLNTYLILILNHLNFHAAITKTWLLLKSIRLRMPPLKVQVFVFLICAPVS